MRQPILMGASDIDQLHRIWQLCGTPTSNSWLGYDKLPGMEGYDRTKWPTEATRSIQKDFSR